MKSKSTEALESLTLLCKNIQNGTNMIFNTTEILNKLNTIKQDIERLQQLQKEIAELKDQISYLKEELEGYQNLYEWSQSKNSILKLKNQELEEENQKLKKDYNLLDTTMESDDRIICELLKEKEQLKNDIKLNETQIDDLTLEVANYKHALEEKNEIIMDLKEKNQELKYKFKKATEILKRSFTVRLEKLEPHYHIVICGNIRKLTQQEYELLKEASENE